MSYCINHDSLYNILTDNHLITHQLQCKILCKIQMCTKSILYGELIKSR